MAVPVRALTRRIILHLGYYRDDVLGAKNVGINGAWRNRAGLIAKIPFILKLCGNPIT